mmetsp:Transcript_23778/g.30809  ORF Transcript_23778/g.30809 Transcript_23778/m.30809 type:complete len:251 (+) Transcript_23778:763-1515(+)
MAFFMMSSRAFRIICSISMALIFPLPSVSNSSKSAFSCLAGLTHPVVGSNMQLYWIHSSRSTVLLSSTSISTIADVTAFSNGSGVSMPSAIHINALSSSTSRVRLPSSSNTPKANQGSIVTINWASDTWGEAPTLAKRSESALISASVGGVPSTSFSSFLVPSKLNPFPSDAPSAIAASLNFFSAFSKAASTFCFICMIKRASMKWLKKSKICFCSETHCFSSPKETLSDSLFLCKSSNISPTYSVTTVE